MPAAGVGPAVGGYSGEALWLAWYSALPHEPMQTLARLQSVSYGVSSPGVWLTYPPAPGRVRRAALGLCAVQCLCHRGAPRRGHAAAVLCALARWRYWPGGGDASGRRVYAAYA